jgi:glycosyltransferase involved in cell wall biosynthesis
MRHIAHENERPPLACDVLHVVWSGDPSGIISQLAGILRGAREASPFLHRACFLEGRGALGDALVADGLAFRLGLRSGWGPIGLWRLWRALRQARPRVVHFHVAAFGPMLVAFAALSQARFFWTQHDPGVFNASLRFDIFYRVFRRRFSCFVVPAAAIVPAVEAHGVPQSRIAVAPHGLTVPFRHDHVSDHGRGSTVGTVARLHPEKRLDLFIDVAVELERRGIEFSAVLVGDGPDGERLRRYAEARGMAARVSFAGEQVDVVPWLDRMDVFLMTSAVEISGLAPLEAMARGVPVVSLPSLGGMEEIVSRGGRVLPDRDVTTAANAVADLFASPAAREALRARGAEVAAERTVGRTVSTLDALYRRELDSPGRRER